MATQTQVNNNIQKYDIKLKSKPKDGVILQLHHTIRGSNGESKRIRFSVSIFEDTHDKLACADTIGNIFILDFTYLLFWKLKSLGSCTALQFAPYDIDTLLIALHRNFEIKYVDTESSNITQTLSGHTAPVSHISFSNNKINKLLTASSLEAILWEPKNHTKYFTLNTYSGPQIQQILFTPTRDYLVGCFQNDTVQIWRQETMQSVKQIIPNELKHIKSVAFTMNGRAMAISGLAPILILFSLDTWKALKSIDLLKYNISGVQQTCFIPQMFDGGCNKVLALLSSDCLLYFFDLESLKIIHTIYSESSRIRKFIVSPTGKYFCCILQQGEVNIYNTSQVMESIKSLRNFSPNIVLPSTSPTQKRTDPVKKNEVEQRMRVCMDSARLRRILMQYGEYPEKFRSIIWRSLLNTPRNKKAYSALVDKGIHPAYKDIEQQFTIHSSVTLKNLKRLLSCLAHWCPLFGVMKFLPSFVFPFVKVLQKDPLLLFESVATILLNQCQLWFEYAPFPPISILTMIENILAEHDQQLLDHFCKFGVTSQTYALKILETAFSEVLTCSEWLILWDHILSNEPAFFLMAIVSYNTVQRNALRKLQNHEEVDNFFHMQNPINKKTLLKKAYIFLNRTNEEIHPRRFFNPFIALEKGASYQHFTGYPKATICLKLAKQTKPKKSENYTLKELTAKTQEAEIKKRSNDKDKFAKKDSSDNDSEAKYKLRDDEVGRNNDICYTKNNGIYNDGVKDESSFLCSSTKHSHKSKPKSYSKCSKKDNEHKRKDDERQASSKSKQKLANSNNLEQEIETLIQNCSNAEDSEN